MLYVRLPYYFWHICGTAFLRSVSLSSSCIVSMPGSTAETSGSSAYIEHRICPHRGDSSLSTRSLSLHCWPPCQLPVSLDRMLRCNLNVRAKAPRPESKTMYAGQAVSRWKQWEATISRSDPYNTTAANFLPWIIIFFQAWAFS